MGVVQDCHNSLISAFIISQLDLLLTSSHSSGSHQTGISADSTTLYLMPESQVSLSLLISVFSFLVAFFCFFELVHGHFGGPGLFITKTKKNYT